MVADEVRNLATKSQEAVADTTALIEDSIRSVANGFEIADGTAKSLAAIVEGANEVTALVGRISEVTGQQAESLLQVKSGINQISMVVQNNSATAEESAAASEELSGQAMLLKNTTSQFNLRD